MAKPRARKKSTIPEEFPLLPQFMDESYDPLMDEDFPVFPKVSRALYDFMSPYATDDFTQHQWKRLIIMAIVAWNAALYPEPMRESFIDRTIKKDIPTDEQADTRFIIDDLIYRKERFFGGFRQMIEQCDVMMNEDGMHIQVISAVPVGS